MAIAITPDQLITALKKWNVKYREYPGWRTRTRPGGIVDARGVVEHHTGGGSASDSYLYFLFVEGRPEEGIPGPLCNVATAPDGTLHVGAIGRANHAGSGSQTVMNHVVAEDYNGYATELEPGPDGVNGNAYYYGNEMIYTGLVAPTDAAYRTAVLHAAAVCDFHGWSALSVIAHREHTRRKNDPGFCPMTKFRTDLATVLKIGPGVVWIGKIPLASPIGDDMSAEDVAAINAHTDVKFAELKTRLDSDEAIERDRFYWVINESRDQLVQVLAHIAAQQEIIDAIGFNQNAEADEDDAEEVLAGQRWAQGIDENRAQTQTLVAQSQALNAKLDELLAAHQPPPVE